MEKLFERIRKLVDFFEKSNQTAFAKKIGCQQSTFNGYLNEEGQKRIRVTLLDDILRAYPQVSRCWLYFGEGKMLAEQGATAIPSQKKEKILPLTPHPDAPDDALGRIALLTGIRTTSGLELQNVFGEDFKILKKFVSRYVQARERVQAWKDAGAKEEDYPGSPKKIPDEWLNYFWTHFGPNPGWIQKGPHAWSPIPVLRERPLAAELSRLRSENEALRSELARLRDSLGKVTPDSAHMPQDAPCVPLGKN